jgi:PST family polysaccharide transporter
VLEKEYRFGRRVVLFEGSAIVGSFLTILLAFLIRNVWALVFGFVGEAAILCCFSFILAPFRPKLKVDKSSLGELMKYARGIFGLPVLTAISFQAPILVLGKVIDDYQLGLYSYAYVLAYFPTDLYMRVVGPILLPAFSKKQDDKSSLYRGLIEATRWMSVTSMPLIAFMACCSSELLAIAYKPEYAIMAFPFTVLSLQVVARNGAAILAGVYLAVGKPHLHRFYAAMRAVVVGFIYPAAVYWGTLGASCAIILGNFLILFLQVRGCRKIVGLTFKDYFNSYVPGLLFSIPVILTFDMLKYLKIDNRMCVFCIGAFMLMVTLAAGTLVTNRPGIVSKSNGLDQ